MMCAEIREIPGLEGYGASSDGRIWSRWKWGRRELTGSWREVKQRRKPMSEYRVVSLGPCQGQKKFQVHRLVVMAFLGPIPDGMHVNHIDCNKANNSIENLEVVTPKENERHAWENGLKHRGIKHHNAKYTEEQVSAIKREYVRGIVTQKQLAEKHGVRLPTVCQILAGRQWTHVQ